MGPHPSSADSRSPASITELELAVSDPDHLFVGLSAEAGGEVSVEEQLDLEAGSVATFCTATGCSADAVGRYLGDDGTVESFRVIAARGEALVFRVTRRDGGIVTTLERAGAITRSAIASDGRGRVVALVPPGEDPPAVLQGVLAAHPSAELVARRVRDADRLAFTTDRGSWRDRLTARQWEVIVRAYESGYFERPRERTGEELAAELGISSATFSQHLRAAQRHLLSTILEGGPDGPANGGGRGAASGADRQSAGPS